MAQRVRFVIRVNGHLTAFATRTRRPEARRLHQLGVPPPFLAQQFRQFFLLSAFLMALPEVLCASIVWPASSFGNSVPLAPLEFAMPGCSWLLVFAFSSCLLHRIHAFAFQSLQPLFRFLHAFCAVAPRVFSRSIDLMRRASSCSVSCSMCSSSSSFLAYSMFSISGVHS